jgi:hypothetical protein
VTPDRRLAGQVLAAVSADARFLAVAIAVGAAPGLAALAWGPADERMTLLVSPLVMLYLQLLATFRTLRRAGLAPPGFATEGRFASAFLGSLLYMLGVIGGLVLLVVPGVLLIGLWSLWLPAFAAEELRPIDALSRSWRLARPRFGRLLVVALAVGMLYGATASVNAALAMLAPGSLLPNMVGELLLVAVQIVSAIVWAVAYLGIRREQPAT